MNSTQTHNQFLARIMRQTPALLSSYMLLLLAVLLTAGYALPRTFLAVIKPTALLRNAAGSGQNLTHILIVAVCALAAWSVYAYPVLGKSRHVRLVWVSVLIYIVICILNCFDGDDSTTAACTLILLSFAVGLLAARLCSSTERVLMLLFIIGLVQAAYSIAGFLSGSLVMFSGNIARASGTVNQPNGLYTEMLFCIFPGVFWLLRTRKHFAVLLVCTLMTAALVCALVLTWNRGGFLGLGAGAFYFSYPFLRRSRLALALTISGLAAFVLFSAVWRTRGEDDSRKAGVAAYSRVVYVKQNLEQFGEHPLTGTGINPKPATALAPVQGSKTFMSKNLLLNLMVEMGLFGLLLFAAFCVGIAGSVARMKGLTVRLTLGATWIALLTASMFDVPFLSCLRSEGNTLFGVLVGATLLAASKQAERDTAVVVNAPILPLNVHAGRA